MNTNCRGDFMDNRLTDLYHLPDPYEEQNLYLLDLRAECARLEDALLDAAESLPEHAQMLLQGYISARDELEFQSVKAALRFGKK